MLWEPMFFMWTDGHTDMKKLIVAFPTIAKEPIKNERVS